MRDRKLPNLTYFVPYSVVIKMPLADPPIRQCRTEDNDPSQESSELLPRIGRSLAQAVDDWAPLRFWAEHRVAEINAASATEVLQLIDTSGPHLGFEIQNGESWYRLEMTQSGVQASLTSSSSWSPHLSGEPSSTEGLESIFLTLLETNNTPVETTKMLESNLDVPK